MDGKDYPDFSGKTLSIEIIGDSTNHDIDNPVFEMQCGRLFLIGTVPPGSTDSDWTEGKTFAIAWERVEHYVVFDSVSDFRQATRISEEYQEATKYTNPS